MLLEKNIVSFSFILTAISFFSNSSVRGLYLLFLKIDSVRFWFRLILGLVTMAIVASEFKLTPVYGALRFLLLGAFLVNNLFRFYCLFEATLVPMLYLILKEG